MRLRLQRVDALSAIDIDGRFFCWAIDRGGLPAGAYRISVSDADGVPVMHVIELQRDTVACLIGCGNSVHECEPGAICVGRFPDKARQTLGHSRAACNALLAILTAAQQRHEPIELEVEW